MNGLPEVWRVDASLGDEAADEQRESSTVRVRESTQIQHAGVRRREGWPFLYYQGSDSRLYFNPGKRRARRNTHSDIGEALW